MHEMMCLITDLALPLAQKLSRQWTPSYSPGPQAGIVAAVREGMKSGLF